MTTKLREALQEQALDWLADYEPTDGPVVDLDTYEYVLIPLVKTIGSAFSKKVETLFDAIKHGDDAHQAWLKEAIENYFSGKPVPPPVMKALQPPTSDEGTPTETPLIDSLVQITGYVQVPVEPTQDWLDSVANRLGIGDAEMRELHSALLAATPTPSDSKPGEGKCQDQ